MSHIVENDTANPPPKHTDAHPAVVTGDTARQAPRGKRVLYVLMAALALIAVAFGTVYVVESFTGSIKTETGS
jgi:hypothetical protein